MAEQPVPALPALRLNHDVQFEPSTALRMGPALAYIAALEREATQKPPPSNHSSWKPGDKITNSTILPLAEGVSYLQQMLQMAVEVEHSVIPPYLSALYSIQNDGTDEAPWHSTVIQGVVIEEMLHMTIAANVLNAVGGHPAIDRAGFVPSYPMVLPELNISVGNEPFSINQAYKFRLIELPNGKTTLAAPGESISDVYNYIISLMAGLCKQHGEPAVFTGSPDLQIEVHSPTTGETVSKITNLTGAVSALLEVVEQGAGMSDVDITAGPLGGEFAHFARFEEIYMGRLYQPNDTVASGPTGGEKSVNWTAISTFMSDPSPDDHPEGSEARELLTYFAANYTVLLSELHSCFNGSPDMYYKTLAKMYVLGSAAVNLMKTPDPRFPPEEGVMLGPTFLWLGEYSRYKDDWHGYTLPMPPRPLFGG